MKKIALLVAIIFSLLALAISANAEVTGSCGPNATWSFDDTTGALTISGSGEVTSSPWSSYAASIKNIVVGNGITRIESGVFYGCNAVEKMTLPFIGEKEGALREKAVLGYVFGYKMGDYDYGWPSYESLGFGVQYVSYSTQSYTAGGHEHEDQIHLPYTYYLPKTLKQVTLTKGTVRGFTNSAVTALIIGEYVTKAEKGAFTSTADLVDIEILGTVSNIEYGTFNGSGYYADQSNWQNGILYIDGHLVEFTDKSATEYTVRDGTRAIASKAFLNCTKLEKIILPSGISMIPTDTFSGCTSVKEMTVPFAGSFVPTSVERLTVLGGQIYNGCFKGYTSLEEVILEDLVTSIGSNAFENCSSLRIITIPSSVTAFGNNIFNSAVTICGNAGSVAQGYAEANGIPFVTCIHSFADWIISDTVYRQCSKCGETENAIIEGECGDGLTWELNKMTGVFSVFGEGDMYSYAETSAPWITEASRIKTITIEDGVTSIGTNAFKNCSFVNEITVPESVTVIHDGAISDCSNATIKVYIGSYAEDHASRHSFMIDYLDIPDKMGNNWSYYATSGRLNVYGDSVTSVDPAWSEFAQSVRSIWVADSVKTIGRVFKDFTYLEEIKLPFIGKSADAESYESVLGYIFNYEMLYGYLYYEEEWQSPLSTYQYTVDTYINDELDTDYSEFYCYFIPKTLRSVILSGETIPERAFYNCSMLEKVFAVNSKTIGADAFKESSATAYSVVNGALHTYAVKNKVPFVAYCVGESGHDYDKKVTAPTCSAQGYTTYTCKICNYSHNSAFVETIAHEYESVVTPPTCSADGYTTHTCKNCSDSYTDTTVAKTGHSYGEWVKNESDSKSYQTCSACGESISRVCTGPFGAGITWFIDFNTETLYLSGSGAIEDYTASSYNPLGQNKEYYKHVIIEEGITAIGSYTFNSNGYVKSVSLPSTLTEIHNFAFNNCPMLKKVTVPSLTQWLTFDFAAYTQNPLYTGSAELYIGDELLEELVIPAEITTVKPYSFAGCTGIKSVVLPDTVLSIDNASFFGCKSITSIKFSGNMTVIASNAFQACTALREVTIPENITKVNYNAFKGCTALEKVTVLLKTTSFGSSVFSGCTKVTLYGYDGSRAQAYAEKNSIPFVIITETGECSHSFGEWKITEATCTEDGVKTRSCIACGVTETETIPSKGHSYTSAVTPPTCTDGGYTTTTCEACGDSYVSDETDAKGHSFGEWVVDKESGVQTRECSVCGVTETEKLPEEAVSAVFTISDAKAAPGETVKLTLSLKTETEINSIALTNFTYDGTVLEFVGFADYEAIEERSFTAVFDKEKCYVLIGFGEPSVFDGDICTLEFKVKEDATDGVTAVSATPLVKLSSTVIPSELEPAEFTVYTYLKGDIDGDEDVDLDDAVYLFGYSMIPDFYPTEYKGSMDFNKDGNVDIEDAILLFNYSMLPDVYPID